MASAPSASVKYKITLQNNETVNPRFIGELIKFTTPTPYGLVKSTEDLSIAVTLIEAVDSLKIGKSKTPCTGTGLAYTCNVAQNSLPEKLSIVYTKTNIIYKGFYIVYTVEESCHNLIDEIPLVQIKVPTDDTTVLSLKIGTKTSTKKDDDRIRTFTFAKNAFNAGDQTIILIRDSIETVSITYTFKPNFAIETSNPLNAYQNAKFEFELTFTSEITDKHITITYMKPGETNPNDATYAINSGNTKKITVKIDPASTFALTGDYVFTIADTKFTSLTLIFTIAVADPKYPTKPPTFTNNGIFYYDGTSPLTSTSLVSFTEAVTDLAVFSKVVASRTGKTIQLKLVQDSDNTKYKLTISDPIDNTIWGKYDTLKFYEVDETTVKFTLNNFIIINADTIPKTLSGTYATKVKISANMKSVDVLFEQEIYAEYFETTSGNAKTINYWIYFI